MKALETHVHIHVIFCVLLCCVVCYAADHTLASVAIWYSYMTGGRITKQRMSKLCDCHQQCLRDSLVEKEIFITPGNERWLFSCLFNSGSNVDFIKNFVLVLSSLLTLCFLLSVPVKHAGRITSNTLLL